MYRDGSPASVCARSTGIDASTILDHARKLGIWRPRLHTDATKDKIAKLYSDGIGLRTLQKRTGIKASVIRTWVQKRGICRSIKDAAKIPRLGTRIPHAFSFLPLNPATAWALGLIFSDGSIRKDGFGITISIGDEDADAVSKISAI